jgi:hypothetical protein
LSFSQTSLPPFVPQSEPSKLVAGDSWTWNRYFARFLTTDTPPWSVNYYVVGPNVFTFPAFQDPNNTNRWLVSLPPSFAAAALPGTYQWVAKASRANPNLGQTPATSPAFWQVISPLTYNSGTTYGAGVYVSEAGTVYLSLVAGNTGHDPATSPSEWQAISSTVWASGTTYTPGQYVTDAIPALYIALSGLEQHDAAAGVFTIIPNYATAGAQKSFNQQMYEQICAVLLNRSTADVQEYTIFGRKLVRMTVAELEGWKSVYEARLAKERNPGGMPMQVKVRFGGGGWPYPGTYRDSGL